MHGRKIFGLKYNDEIEAIVCIALCPEVPFTVREMDYMSRRLLIKMVNEAKL